MIRQLGNCIANFVKSQSSAQAVEFSLFVALISLTVFIFSHGVGNSFNALPVRMAR